MNQNIINGLAAIRMAASSENLKAAAFISASDANAKLQSKAQIEVTSSELEDLAKSNKIEIGTSSIIKIEGEGYVLIADSQAQIENLKAGSDEKRS